VQYQVETPREGTLAARSARAKADGAPRPGGLGRTFKWVDVRSLWKSRNDVLVRFLPDPTNRLREEWMRMQQQRGLEGDLVLADYRDRTQISCIVLGDPGEGDWSQRVVVNPLITLQEECEFMVICSDVNYPIGDINEYESTFYEPYVRWTKPIYAAPGNHDWYDEGQGFMFHFCGTDPLPTRGWAKDVPRPPLWRRPRRARPIAHQCRAGRPAGRGDFQPAPYFVIDTGPLALVCIDTGIKGDLDRDQGGWLARVSCDLRKPKVLVTGKPLIVDGVYRPGPIESLDRTVDDIVREPEHGYVAAIGGDIHNYQRYPVKLSDGRRLEYIVAGGGGAFMHATHRIDRVDIAGVDEDAFRCFPLRGDSLWFYASTLVPALRRLWILSTILAAGPPVLTVALGFLLGFPTWWGFLAGLLAPMFVGTIALFREVNGGGGRDALRFADVSLTPEQASSYMAAQLDTEPTVSTPTDLRPEQLALMEFVRPRLGAGRGVLHTFFSEIFDVDRPPLYKQFLRLDADAQMLRITCHAAIGTPEEQSRRPYVEEWVEIPLGPAWEAVGR
jgi:hypothetical protein